MVFIPVIHTTPARREHNSIQLCQDKGIYRKKKIVYACNMRSGIIP